ncbi:hypothetical protein GCM10018773_32230 [Streptomyces candidus]|nr:hypothetical protein GCM10018773_32230 [Streptomyces candidus]
MSPVGRSRIPHCNEQYGQWVSTGVSTGAPGVAVVVAFMGPTVPARRYAPASRTLRGRYRRLTFRRSVCEMQDTCP